MGGVDALTELLGKLNLCKEVATALISSREKRKLSGDTPKLTGNSKFAETPVPSTPVPPSKKFSTGSEPVKGVLDYGHLQSFYHGLEGLVGPPSPNLAEAMKREHATQRDSMEYFTVNNYGTCTTSKIEFYFVAEPEAGLDACGLSEYPKETKLPEGEERDDRARMRRPNAIPKYDAAVKEKNEQLHRQGQQPLINEELVGARLYTGPMSARRESNLRPLAPRAQPADHFAGTSSTIPF